MNFLESVCSGTLSVLAAVAILALGWWVMSSMETMKSLPSFAMATNIPVKKAASAQPTMPTWSPNPDDTKCTITGNHWFTHKCPKNGGFCKLELAIQYYIESHHLWTQMFTVYCQLVDGPGKQYMGKSTIHRTILGYGDNEMGGVFFKWDKVTRGTVKREYTYNCACFYHPTEGPRTIATTFKEIFTK